MRVGGRVGVEKAPRSVEALLEAGEDVIVVDTAHWPLTGVLDACAGHHRASFRRPGHRRTSRPRRVPRHSPKRRRRRSRVGYRPGSICTTRVVPDRGPADHRVANVADALARSGVPRSSPMGNPVFGRHRGSARGGRHSVMIGSLFAGTEESPGETELYQGRSYKAYRGMG